MIKKALTLMFFVIAFSSCVNDPYIPFDGNYGYTTVVYNDSKYEVSFTGQLSDNLTMAKQFAVYCAAELTLMHGKSHFVIEKTTSYMRIERIEYPSEHRSYQSRDGSGRVSRSSTYVDSSISERSRPVVILKIRAIDKATDGTIVAQEFIDKNSHILKKEDK